MGITVDTDGNVFICGSAGVRGIWKVAQNGELLFSSSFITDCVWDGDKTLYVCDTCASIRAFRIDLRTWEYFATPIGANETKLAQKTCVEVFLGKLGAIAYGNNGRLYTTDNKKIFEIHVDGSQAKELTSQKIKYPGGLAVDTFNNVYVTDYYEHCIWKIEGDLVSLLAGTPGKEGYQDGIADTALFKRPHSITCGRDATLYVLDANGFRSIHIQTKVVSSISYNSVGVQEPQCITIDPSGYIWIQNQLRATKLPNLWKWRRWERYLWIAFFKEDSSYCMLASVPKDIVRVIVSYLWSSSMQLPSQPH